MTFAITCQLHSLQRPVLAAVTCYLHQSHRPVTTGNCHLHQSHLPLIAAPIFQIELIVTNHFLTTNHLTVYSTPLLSVSDNQSETATTVGQSICSENDL